MKIRQLLKTIREELVAADNERKQAREAPLFTLDRLDLEIKVLVSETKELDGGLNLQVVSIGGAKSVENTNVHTVKLSYRVDESAQKEHKTGTRAHSSSDQCTPKRTVKPLE